jgi:catalase
MAWLTQSAIEYTNRHLQVAFHPGHIVPGSTAQAIRCSRGLYSPYTDTQLTRLGGPNFAQILINRPTCPMHNHEPADNLTTTLQRL